MRIPVSARRAGYAAAFLAAAGSVVLMSAPRKSALGIHEKATYADARVVNFIRPGLKMSIVSATIAGDGTISVDYKLTDPKQVALDVNGFDTPGKILVSFVAAYIPKGQSQYVAYTTRIQTSPITKVSATQAAADSGGTTKTVATGEYIYTFKQKATPPAGGYDPTATHRIGMYGSRDLTEFDLGTNYASAVYDFVPGGGAPAPRDVIRTETCNKCHDQLAFHGGSRQGMELCVMCHTPQTTDPDTGNTVDMKVFIHKLHMGSSLPSVKAGGKYQIIGFNQGVSDWSTVALPSDARRCQFCHESTTGAKQANNWLTNPNQAACGACHDDVNFKTGANHATNLAQADDSKCTECHMAQGDKEFDASIKGAHVYPQESAANPGLVFKMVKVDNGVAGAKPTVTFTVRDFQGNGIPMSAMTGGSNRIALVMAGPTWDYGYTSFGSDVTTPGYVSENPVPSAKCSPDGTCTYTFTHAIPAKATGSYSIGIEGRRTFTNPDAPTGQQSVNYGAKNDVITFSVDGSPVQARRTVVATANCNQCHDRLSLHGENRNQVEMCVLCHNPSENDSSTRANATVAADKALPPQSVNFAKMIHTIHTGEKLAEAGLTYTIVGFNGSHNEFSDVRYPAMGPTGTTGDTAKCDMCHVNGSEATLPIGRNDVKDPQGALVTAPATTSACTACHFTKTAVTHAVNNWDPQLGEACDVCHASGAAYDVDKMHAGQ